MKFMKRMKSHRGLGIAAAMGVMSVLGVAVYAAIHNPQPEGPIDPFAAGTGLDYWSMVGSAGAVDDSDQDIYRARGGLIQLNRQAGDRARLIVRYPVTVTQNLIGPNTQEFVSMRFRDNGPDATVIAHLKSYDAQTGAVETHLTMNSDDYLAFPGFQLQTQFENIAFDFQTRVYFLDVVLRKSGPDGNPGLTLLVVGKVP